MKRNKWLEGHYKRWERVAKLYHSGKTFEEIGNKLGITRQQANRLYLNWKKMGNENE